MKRSGVVQFLSIYSIHYTAAAVALITIHMREDKGVVDSFVSSRHHRIVELHRYCSYLFILSSSIFFSDIARCT